MKVASGGVYVSLSMAERFAERPKEPIDTQPRQRPSDHEFDVFRRIAKGKTITEIATELKRPSCVMRCTTSCWVRCRYLKCGRALQFSTEHPIKA